LGRSLNHNVAIIGCGLIGKKRASALGPNTKLKYCLDLNPQISQEFSEKYNCLVAVSVEQILRDPSVSIVIVATRHDKLSELAIQAVNSGKHVLVEKPASRSYSEFKDFVKIQSGNSKTKIHVGYNHRFHPAVIKAIEIFQSGGIGEVMYLRGRYGHGGRLGYEKEWRFEKSISGGGELIDQGTHLLDLSIAFLGNLEVKFSQTKTYFWNTDLEDNAFVVLENEKGKIAFLQVSCTEWKNLFSLEIYGKLGKLEINGLGGSYGLEKLTYYRMLPELGPPRTETWEYPEEDSSWSVEFMSFLEDIEKNGQKTNNVESSALILKIIDEIYQGNKK
jgi:predicted dehydrogenase